MSCLYCALTYYKLFVAENEWSDWSDCSVSCGLGTQQRNSICAEDSCIETKETRPCNAGPCTRKTTHSEQKYSLLAVSLCELYFSENRSICDIGVILCNSVRCQYLRVELYFKCGNLKIAQEYEIQNFTIVFKNIYCLVQFTNSQERISGAMLMGYYKQHLSV